MNRSASGAFRARIASASHSSFFPTLYATLPSRFEFLIWNPLPSSTESDPALPSLEELEAPAVDVSSLNSDRVIALMTDVGIL